MCSITLPCRNDTEHISPPAVDSRKEYRNPRPAQENSEKTKAAPRIAHIPDPPPPPPPIAYTNVTYAEISPSWRIHSNPVKEYHYTFERKPDDGHLGRNM